MIVMVIIGKKKIIEYEIDSIGCMIAFQPADLDLDEIL